MSSPSIAVVPPSARRPACWHLLVVAAIACHSTGPSGPIKRGPPAEQIENGLLPIVQVRGEQVRHTIEERMREYKIPALSIAVFDNYELVWTKAYGLADVASGTRADEGTLFLAGSISKSVNALGQLTAVRDGLLALDAPINDALSSWKLPDNDLTRATPVTLRMLLSHTAGTTVHGFRGYAAGEAVPTIQQILDGEAPANSAPIRVDLAPSTKFRYSGGGTTITQLAISERAKLPYQQVLEERVLRPLRMANSSFEQTLTPERLRQAAVGYDQEAHEVEGKRFAYPEMAAAGLWTTPTDLARFFLEIARARAGTSPLISKTIALQMTTKVIDVEGGGGGPTGVGLGVFLLDRNGTPWFGHNGADVGFQADAIASLDGGRGMVIMANSENGHLIFPEIERTVFAVFGWPGADTPITRVALEPAQRAKFVGRYAFGPVPFEIVERAGKLIARTPFTDGFEAVPTSAEDIVNTGDGSRFHLADNGLAVVNGPVPLAPRLTDHPLFLAEDGRIDDAAAALEARPDANQLEGRINFLGYQLMSRDPAKAAQLLRVNVVAFPDSANAHDSYGEALMKSGKTAEAIAEYERVLVLLEADPRIPPADKPRFKQNATDQLTKLRAK